MTRAERLKNLKMQFKRFMLGEEAALAATATLTTNDGKSILVMGEDAAEGLQVYLLDAENNQTELPDGDYILSDGRTITVAAGVISTIKEADAPKEDAPAEMATETAPETEAAPEDNADTDLADRITALEESVNQIIDVLNGAVSMQKQTMSTQKELVEKFAKFSEEPSEKPTVLATKINDNKTSKDTMMEEILALKNNKRK